MKKFFPILLIIVLIVIVVLLSINKKDPINQSLINDDEEIPYTSPLSDLPVDDIAELEAEVAELAEDINITTDISDEGSL
jgi:hypothetical protein